MLLLRAGVLAGVVIPARAVAGSVTAAVVLAGRAVIQLSQSVTVRPRLSVDTGDEALSWLQHC